MDSVGVVMSLEKYRRPRLVVLHPNESAYGAARAMEANHVGVVLIEEKGVLRGIATDRDLAIRVIGRGLEAALTPLVAVMTPGPSTLSVMETEERAAELMRIRRVRRVPLLEGERLVGLVTLDDLLLESSLDSDLLATVVRAQLEEPAPLKPAGLVHPEKPVRRHRHEARAQETYGRLLHRVEAATGLPRRELAETALDVVLAAVIRRITPQEAEDLLAQLPSKLQERLALAPRGPDRTIGLATVARALAERLELGPEDAMRVARGVGTALEQVVSGGEIEDVRSQLPVGMRELFPHP
jgi:CBS domain-containing protein/uncharacterized protein (DUF2267 family)